jgi:hypothetical protein
MRVMRLTLVALVVCGCRASPPEGVFACETDADCPGYWVCNGGRCWSSVSTRHDGGDEGDPAGDGLSGDPFAGDPGPCHDGVQNHGETDIDCGHVCPTPCANGEHCEAGIDCLSGWCDGTLCADAPENCFDGIDNDGDDDIDCADDECTTIAACVPEVSAPFDGYYRIRADYFGTTTNLLCRDGESARRYFATPLGHSCALCTCGALSGASCGLAQLYCDPDGGCNSNQLVNLANACVYRPFAGQEHMTCQVVSASVTSEGSCAPAGGTPVLSGMWDQVVDACGGPLEGVIGVGCGAEVCVPAPEPGYGGICVAAYGVEDCPVGYPNRLLVYDGGTDNRDCTACGCIPQVTCSGATFHINDGVTCNTNDPHILDFGSTNCVDVGWVNDGGNGTWSVQRRSPDAPSGECTPTGGQPIGSVEPAGTRTVCCQ